MGTKFFVVVEGVETEAQRSLIRSVKRIGQTEVDSSEDCDYLLVFCPIVSCVAADINGALARMPANKPAILAVLHHTYDKYHTIAESSRHVHDQNVKLTVDFLFWNEKLLNCNFNDQSWVQIQNHLGSSNNWPAWLLDAVPQVQNRLQAMTSSLPSIGFLGEWFPKSQTKNIHGCEPKEMGTKFFVVVDDVETEVQKTLIQRVIRIGQTKVESSEDCDYLLVFCPIVSRVATDINGALARIPANKPAILVVLHHTNDKTLAIAESRRQVHDPNVELTVDFLFWNKEVLNCNLNDQSWAQIQNHLGCSNNWYFFNTQPAWLLDAVPQLQNRVQAMTSSLTSIGSLGGLFSKFQTKEFQNTKNTENVRSTSCD